MSEKDGEENKTLPDYSLSVLGVRTVSRPVLLECIVNPKPSRPGLPDPRESTSHETLNTRNSERDSDIWERIPRLMKS